MKKWLLGMTPAEIKKVVAELALPTYTAGQIVGWIYGKRVPDFESMTNLSKLARTLLDEIIRLEDSDLWRPRPHLTGQKTTSSVTKRNPC